MSPPRRSGPGAWRRSPTGRPGLRLARSALWRAGPRSRRLWLFQAHVLPRRGEVEERVQADPRLLDPWPDPVQRGRLEKRGVHDALVHQPLDLMQHRLTLLAV